MAFRVALALLLVVCSVELGWTSPTLLHSRRSEESSANATSTDNATSSDSNPFLNIAQDFEDKLSGLASHFLGRRSVSVRDTNSTTNSTASNSTTNDVGSFIEGAVDQIENIFKNPFGGIFGKRDQQFTIGDVFQEAAKEWFKQKFQRPVAARDTSSANTTTSNSTSSANATQQDNIFQSAVNGIEDAFDNIFGGFFGKRSVNIRDSESTSNSTSTNSTGNTSNVGSFIEGAVDQFENIFKNPFGGIFGKRQEQFTIGDVFREAATQWVKERFQRPVSARDTSSSNSTTSNSTTSANSTQSDNIIQDAVSGIKDAFDNIFGGFFGKRSLNVRDSDSDSNSTSTNSTDSTDDASSFIQEAVDQIENIFEHPFGGLFGKRDGQLTIGDLYSELAKQWVKEHFQQSDSSRDTRSTNSTASNSTSDSDSAQQSNVFQDAVSGMEDAFENIFGGWLGKRSAQGFFEVFPQWINNDWEEVVSKRADNSFTMGDMFVEVFKEWLKGNVKRSVTVRDVEGFGSNDLFTEAFEEWLDEKSKRSVSVRDNDTSFTMGDLFVELFKEWLKGNVKRSVGV